MNVSLEPYKDAFVDSVAMSIWRQSVPESTRRLQSVLPGPDEWSGVEWNGLS